MDWFTADTHFFHKNVIEYSKRPWSTVEEMTEGLVQRWNNRVAKNDRVFVLGDFAFGNKDMIKAVTPRLHGTKVLVRGNHDVRSGPFYVEAGFTSVSPLPMLYEERYLLSHIPMLPPPSNLINIHGHLHNGENPCFWTPQNICVSVEMTGYAPVTLKEILQMLEDKKALYYKLMNERQNQAEAPYDLRVDRRD